MTPRTERRGPSSTTPHNTRSPRPETTTGQTAEGLPGEYHLSWRTNGESMWVNILSTGTWQQIGPIPPELLSELREALG